MKNPILVMAGPTASGKTDLAVKIAKEFNGEIVNADSRTIYREMNIATSKPTEAEMAGVPHHLFDIVNPDQEFTLADYKNIAQEKIKEVQSRGKLPLVVGGTGLYVDAVIYDFNLTESMPSPKLRKELEAMSEKELYTKLEELDPISAENIDKCNKRRLIRALEVVISTNKSFYESKKRKELPPNVLYLAIDIDRNTLVEKINNRINHWRHEGLLEETNQLMKKYPLDLPSMSSIGYREIAKAINGEIGLKEALELMKIHTRQYAKRQMTWFKRNPDIVWIKNGKEAEEELSSFLGND